ncbi:MAG: CvpA family protein, partial [Candidatus Omnitrophica bacterium]|nr:CvpA family protein [Candidatus Omnitrophota bacterium]
LKEIIFKFNWIDLFFLVLIIRIFYVSYKTGLVTECFKFLGAISAVYLSLHYYTTFSDLIYSRFLTQKLPLDFIDFLSFIILSILGYLIIVSIRGIFVRFIKIEAMPNLNKFAGMLFGAARAVLVVSLISFTLTISSVSYLENSVKDSYLAWRLFKAAPVTYSWLWNSLVAKFMPSKESNKIVSGVERGFHQR